MANIKMPFFAAPLDRTRRAGEAGALIEKSGFLDRESELAVGGCRGLSRLVVAHYLG